MALNQTSYCSVTVAPTIGNPCSSTSLILCQGDSSKKIQCEWCYPILISSIKNGPTEFGFGAAAFVELLEEALLRLHGTHDVLRASKLGKPYPPIFIEAVRRAESDNAVMIGDQLETDVLGTNNAGVDSAVVTTGINKRSYPNEFKDIQDKLTPRYILTSLV